jgi:hypothetical protein
MKYWFKRKLQQIKRVIDFFPIIWNGYDWDYRYAIELFQHQLTRTADAIEKNGIHVDKENTANRIRTSVKLMKKVYDEDYQFEYAQKIEDKYGPSYFDFVETGDLDHNGEPLYRMVEYFKKDYSDTERLLIEEEKSAELWDARAKQARAHKLLWKYIEHNIQRWWD